MAPRGNDFLDEVYDPQVRLLDVTLRGAGVEPESVVAIVNSHLHFGHCGQNPLFHGRSTRVFAQRAEVANVERDPSTPMHRGPCRPSTNGVLSTATAPSPNG